MRPLRLAIAGLLGAATALLVACGSGGGANLIPAGVAGPLQNDFTTISNYAANGNCSALSGAFAQAQHDISALPATVDPRLHRRLEQGLADLRRTAPRTCAQATTTTNTTPTSTTTTSTTPTNTTPTNTTPTNTTPTTTTPTTTTPPNTTPTDTTPTTTAPGGGTAVPPSGGAGGAGSGGAAPGNGNG